MEDSKPRFRSGLVARFHQYRHRGRKSPADVEEDDAASWTHIEIPPDKPIELTGLNIIEPTASETNSVVHAEDQPTVAPIDTLGSRVLETLGIALADLETVLNVLPLLKSVICGLRICMALTDVHITEKNRQEYDEMATHLTSIAYNLRTYIVQLDEAIIPQSTQRVISDIQKLIVPVKLRRERCGATNPEGTLVNQEMAQYRSIVSLLDQLQIDIQQTYANAREKITDAITTCQREAPAYNAVYNAALPTDIHRPICSPDTCLEILDTIRTWTTRADGPKVLWITGMPGTGKTTIAYTICRQFDKEKVLGASFFCSANLPDCRDVNRIIPTIAYQLARFSKKYWEALSETLVSPSATEPDISIQFSKLLTGPLLKAQDALPRNMVVAIDALDECTDVANIRAILALLLQHANELPIKFLLTSRSDLLAKLAPFPDDALVQLFHIDQSINVYIYLDDLLSPITPQHNIDELSKLAGSQFIFATTAAGYLLPEYEHIDSMDRLLTVLDTQVHSNDTSEASLDRLYTTILSNAFDNKNPLEVNSRQLILWTIVHAREPMAMTAIVELLGVVTQEDVILSIRPLWSILHLSSTTGVMSLRHTSFREFLLDPKRSGRYHCNEAEYSEFLAFRCFAVMQKSLRFNICDLETSTKLDMDVPELDCRITRAITPVLSNACRYWSEYLGKAEPSSRVIGHLHDFLRRRLLFWMEVLNLKGWMEQGEPMLIRAHDWLLHAGAPTNLDIQKLAQDACNFVKSYSISPASESTPHIYISALPSTQRESHIYKSYWPQTRGLLTPEDAQKGGPKASAITSVALSLDNTQVASGSRYGTICVWDVKQNLKLLGPSLSHPQPITSVAFSPSGTRVISGSQDGTICAWEIRKGARPLRSSFACNQPITSIAFSSGETQVISEFQNGTTCVWDMHKGTQFLGSSIACDRTVTSIAFSRDGSRVVYGSQDGTICVWDVQKSLKLLGPIYAHPQPITSVAFSLDGSRIISGLQDETSCVWDIQGRSRNLKAIFVHTQPIISIAVSPDGTRLLSGSQEGTIHAWDIKKKSFFAGPFLAHTQGITSMAFSPDETRIVSGSQDGMICVWNIHTESLLFGPVSADPQAITSVAFSQDGAQIVSGSHGGTIRTWKAHTGSALPYPYPRHSSPICLARFSSDGCIVVSGSQDGTIQTCSLSGRLLNKGSFPLNHKRAANHMLTLPPSSELYPRLTGATDVPQPNLRDTSLIQPYTKNNNAVHLVSPDGRKCISGSLDGKVLVWDAPPSNHDDITGLFKGPGGSPIATSPYGSHVASGSNDGVIRVWDAYDLNDDKPRKPWAEKRIAINGREFWITQEGWVKDSKSRRLLWLSPDDMDGLSGSSLFKPNTPPCSHIIHPNEGLLTNLREIALGKRWRECYTGLPDVESI